MAYVEAQKLTSWGPGQIWHAWHLGYSELSATCPSDSTDHLAVLSSKTTTSAHVMACGPIMPVKHVFCSNLYLLPRLPAPPPSAQS